jgi:hypothetical protein
MRPAEFWRWWLQRAASKVDAADVIYQWHSFGWYCPLCICVAFEIVQGCMAVLSHLEVIGYEKQLAA